MRRPILMTVATVFVLARTIQAAAGQTYYRRVPVVSSIGDPIACRIHVGIL